MVTCGKSSGIQIGSNSRERAMCPIARVAGVKLGPLVSLGRMDTRDCSV